MTKTPVRKLLDCLFKGVARAEGGNPLSRDLYLLTGLGVPALPGLALSHGELPEARNPDLLAALECFGHHSLESLEVLVCLARGHLSLFGDPLDELRFVHEYSTPSSRRLGLIGGPVGVAYPLFVREAEPLAIPVFSAGFAQQIGRASWWE